MSRESQRLAGILLIVLPTVMYGGVMLLTMLVHDPAYMANPLRQNLWRAGHAHAGVFVVFALLAQILADAADLNGIANVLAGDGIWAAAILFPAGFFLSSAAARRSRTG